MGFLFMYNSIMFPCKGEEQWGEEEKGSDGWGWLEVVFLVNRICTPQWGEVEAEVQMEKCLLGDVGRGDGGWDIRGGTSRCW